MFRKKNQIYISLFILFFLFNLILANSCLADHPGFGNATGNIGISAGTAQVSQTAYGDIIVAVVQSLLTFVSVLFFILFLFGGFKWMTAAGSEEKIKDAKKIITNAVIGLGIVIMSYTITYFISKSIETTPTQSSQGTSPVQIKGSF